MNSIRTSSTEADQRSLKQPARKGWGRRTGHLPWLLPLLAVAIVVAVGAWAGLSAPVQAQGTADYDRDDDGLIEVSSLAQLNAIRWDLDGDGSTTDTGYASAFPNAVSGMGCPSAGCTGYELDADLDFDTNGNGEADSGDDYWNDGSGWTPIGTQSSRISTTFDGNGHTISGLFINRGSTDDVGLFGYIDSSSVIRNTSLLSVNITGYSHVGALVGWNRGSITASDTFGSVTGNEYVGGLVGVNRGTIDASYASGSVIGNDSVGGLVGWNSSGGAITASYASGSVTGNDSVGGQVGYHSGDITASYASGSVTGTGDDVGGLVGYNNGGTITASYASGSVTGTGGDVGGLVGYTNAGTITASYWDTETSGQPAQTDSSRGIGKTTSQLQAPTGYTGIYAGWNVDIDNADGDDTLSTGGDNPWDFGTASQYPTINYVPSAPVMLSAMRGDGQVTLTWATGSSVLPITKYQFQGDGSGRGWQDIAGSDATTTSYTVTGLNNGQLYTFRVRAVNQAGPGRASGSAAATPIALPDQPVGLRATPDANSVILDWTAASAGENIIKYQYQQGTVSGQVEYDSDWIDVPSSAMGEANHTSYTIDNLEPGQLYTFRVRAVNPVGPGPASDRVTATPQFLVTISMTGYHISSEPLYGDEYQPGETIEFTYTFSEAVTLLPGRQPRVVIAAPGNRYPQAKYDAARSEQAGDDKLVFTWQVPDGVEGRIWVGPGGLGPSRSIGDLNGNVLAPIKLDYGRSAKIGQKSGGPRMEKGTFANAPAQGNHYQPGEHIHVSTRWDRPIKVNADNPPHALIFINSSPNGVRAEYDQALTELQGNRWVMFSYQVQVGDEDDDQLWLGNQDNGVNSLGNAAGITDYSGNVAVDAWEPGSVSRYGATTPSGVPTVSSAGFVFQYQDGQPVVEQLQPGEVLEYRIRFDRPVRVDQSALPYVNIGINSRGAVGAYYDAQRTATFSEPNVLAFT